MTVWQAKCRTILEKDDLIYEYILQQISPSSMAEIRNDDDFDAVKEEQDWIGLVVIAMISQTYRYRKTHRDLPVHLALYRHEYECIDGYWC